MKWFRRAPLVEVAGVIDRIGISDVNDVSLFYKMRLVDDPRVFTLNARPKGPVDPNVTMAKPGDSVRFSVREGRGYCETSFDNVTLHSGVGSPRAT